MSLRGGFQQQDGCLLFSFTGQLDAYSEKQFLVFINDHLTSTPQPLVLDLSKIDFIYSSGLGARVQFAKHCNDQKLQFLVVGNAKGPPLDVWRNSLRDDRYLHLHRGPE